MKKEKLLRNAFLIALIVWIVMLIKQQINISHYRDDIKELSSKIEVAQSELEQNKQYRFIRIYRKISTWKTRNVFTKWKSLYR